MQEVLKFALIELTEKFGTSNAFIARKIGVSKALISMFRLGVRNLGDENLHKLLGFLNNSSFNFNYSEYSRRYSDST